jgi:uncharacterized protein (TIGR00297 family)
LTGSIATWIVGFTIFISLGLGGWVILMVFFWTCILIDRLARRLINQVSPGLQKKGGCRDHMQVFANGGPATLCGVLYALTGNPIWIRAFAAAMAESTADTWAGEIGLFSKTRPVLITSPFKTVEPGLSGGVTGLGTTACFVGSALIAVTWFGLFRDVITKVIRSILVVTFAGFAGGIWDSVLGATAQAHYWDTIRNRITEHEEKDGVRFRLVRGWRWMDNDMVNLTSNSVAVVLALIM